MAQEEINALLVELGRRGHDAWCGSRAATRSCSAAAARRREALAAAGVPFEVVPGRDRRASRRPPTPGIPVTHRDAASAVAFVTGHEDPAKAESALDWEALAALPRHARASTWASSSLPQIAERLIGGGRDRRRAGRRGRARHAARASAR